MFFKRLFIAGTGFLALLNLYFGEFVAGAIFYATSAWLFYKELEKSDTCEHKWHEYIVHIKEPKIRGQKHTIYTQFICTECGAKGVQDKYYTNSAFYEEDGTLNAG